jgi:predicted dehydrogenase
MKFLVIGGGSMGKRRIRCLLANGIEAGQIRLVDLRSDRLEESKSKYGVTGVSDFKSGMLWEPTACLVAVPGERAAAICAAVMEAGKHVFCEVPMGATVTEAERLRALADRHGVLAASGAQQPFHPLVRQCREWLREASFGKPQVFVLEWGQYVPGWHPWEDYRQFYSAAQMVGVVNLEIVQFYSITDDRIRQVKCFRQHVSSLQIEGGDVWHAVGTTRQGMAFTMHVDLLQRPVRNVARFAGEKGTIEIDFIADQVKRYLVETKQGEVVRTPENYVYEQCYIDEIGLLLRCLRGEAQWHYPISLAVEVMRCPSAMQQSGGEDGITC